MRITAYKTDKHAMEIRPASNKRQWMDETVYQYAYRCLPLQIANSAGWELLSPCDFLITWNGGNLQSDLQVHLAKPEFHFGTSSFGYGIATFHPGYLFRTENDYDLWVQGSPNYFFPFMNYLTGIVETWWNPATFTMNWKLINPGTYEVKEGQPLCFIMPVPHEVPEIEAEIVDLSTEPQMLQEFNTWKASRNQIIKDLVTLRETGQGVNGMDPLKPSTQWEKHYIQGVKHDGTKIENHETKRRMPNFKVKKDI